MTTEPFIQPRFVGERFEGHTLPLSALKDLAAYEELVLDLARHLYLQKRRDRARVPKGFASNFSLGVDQIDEGSARPALVAMIAGTALLGTLAPEITEARNLINTVIATEAGQPLPADFPNELYFYFNRIGRSLADGERIEWLPDAPDNKSVLTPAKRKRLVLADQENYEARAEVLGSVESLDSKKKTGNLRCQEGRAIPFSYPDQYFADLKRALGDSQIYIHISGTGVFDVNDRLQSISEIEQLDSQPHHPLVSSIEKLANLPPGWLEGHGVIPKPEDLDWLAEQVASVFPRKLDYPSPVPTEDGHVILEWIRPQSRIEVEVNFDTKKLELYATPKDGGKFIEKEFAFDELGAVFREVSALV